MKNKWRKHNPVFDSWSEEGKQKYLFVIKHMRKCLTCKACGRQWRREKGKVCPDCGSTEFRKYNET